MSTTKREEIALNTVDQSELNQRRPAVSPDSALPLNRTGSEMDRYGHNNRHMENKGRHLERQKKRHAAKAVHIHIVWAFIT